MLSSEVLWIPMSDCLVDNVLHLAVQSCGRSVDRLMKSCQIHVIA